MLAVLAGSLGAALLLAPDAYAATKVWNGFGGDQNWSDAGNWTDGLSPTGGEDLVFDGSLGLAPTNDFAVGTAFGSITFDSGADVFNLSGNGFTLASGTSTGAGNISGGYITNDSPNNETLSLPVALSNGLHAISTASGAGELIFAGAITVNPGGSALFSVAGGMSI